MSDHSVDAKAWMFDGGRRNGRSFLYTALNNPKGFPKIKNRKLRRGLYRYFAQNKKMRMNKLRGKNIWGKLQKIRWWFDKYTDKINEQIFREQYLCHWDLASDTTEDISVTTIKTKSGNKFLR